LYLSFSRLLTEADAAGGSNHYTDSLEPEDMDPVAAAFALLLGATLLGSVAVVRRLYTPVRPWRDVARARLVYGVPWGSLVVVIGVCGVYLFVQDGITDLANPVTIPYRAWSYFSPLGMVTASFSHAGPSHIVGNLIGAAVVAPLAEYAWGHYPDDGVGEDASAWRTNPWLRAFVLFPLIVLVVGLGTSLFALGPVIGFSGVVFAFAGFAIVHYPIPTLIGTIGVQGALITILQALQQPVSVYIAEPTPPGPPSWATIAIQGHALGFFVGVVLGLLLLRSRGNRPNPLHLWLAVLLFGFSKSLWAIYWFGAENTFVLLRGPGVVLVIALAVVVTLAVTGADRPLVPRSLSGRFARASDLSPVDRPLELAGAGRTGESASRLDRIAELVRSEGTEPSSTGRTHQRGAFAVVLLVTAVLAGMAIPTNLLLVDGATASESAVEIEGYTVEYAEGVDSQLVSPIVIGPFDETITLESSGVIVSNEQRQIWLEAVTSQQLAFTGEETVYVGEPGWREAVTVERTGWEPVGNETVYQVWIEGGSEGRQLAHESNESAADVRLDDRELTVTSEDGEFVLDVEATNDGTDTATVSLPTADEPTEANGLTFEYDNGTVYAASNGTEVAVLERETYS
jgi:membrane associated rhomboid family serine protease